MKLSKLILLLPALLVFLIFSCGGGDDPIPEEAPVQEEDLTQGDDPTSEEDDPTSEEENPSSGGGQDILSISFDTTVYKAEMVLGGATESLTIESESEVSLQFGNTVNSKIFLNTEKMTVMWADNLPVGDYIVLVCAENEAGSKDSAMITIKKPIQGHFEGGYNYDHKSEVMSSEFEMTFNDNNEVEIKEDGFTTTGTWAREGNVVSLVYTYDDVHFFSLLGEVNVGPEVFSGLWYNGPEPVEENLKGAFNLEYSGLGVL